MNFFLCTSYFHHRTPRCIFLVVLSLQEKMMCWIFLIILLVVFSCKLVFQQPVQNPSLRSKYLAFFYILFACEEIGEDVNICYGRAIDAGNNNNNSNTSNNTSNNNNNNNNNNENRNNNNKKPHFQYLSHMYYDGIGGLVTIMRENGLIVSELPKIKTMSVLSPSRSVWELCFDHILNLFCVNRRSANKDKKLVKFELSATEVTSKRTPFAWHAFSREELEEIKKLCKSENITVNTFLFYHLDKAVRSVSKTPELPMSCLLPVNLRGMVHQHRDTDNHSVTIAIRSEKSDNMRTLHEKIQHKLKNGEHLASWKMYHLTRFLPHFVRVALLQGANRSEVFTFSNLGSFRVSTVGNAVDSTDNNADNSTWYFCPNVGKRVPITAGCVTVNEKMTLMIRFHDSFPYDSQLLLNKWIKNICNF